MPTITAVTGPNASLALTRTVDMGATDYQWERRQPGQPWERFLDQGTSFEEYSGIPGVLYEIRCRPVIGNNVGPWSPSVAAQTADPADIGPKGRIQVLIDTETPWNQYLGTWQAVDFRHLLDMERTSGVTTGGLFDPIQPSRFVATFADFGHFLRDLDITGAKLWVAITIGTVRYDIFRGEIHDPELVGRVDFDTGVYRITAFDVLARFARIGVFPDFAVPSNVSSYINAVLDKAGDVPEYDDSGQPTATLAAEGAWPNELRDIVTSERSVTIAALAQDEQVVLTELIRYAEQIDLGVTFVDPSGVVTYADRARIRALSRQTPRLAFDVAAQRFIHEPVTVARRFGEVTNVTVIQGGAEPAIQFVSVDQASVNNFGPREFREDIGPLANSAEDVGTVALTRTSLTRNPTTQVMFDWEPAAPDEVPALLEAELQTPVRVESAEYNLTGNFVLVALIVRMNRNGVWRATFTGRQPDIAEVWQLGDSSDAMTGSALHDSYYAPDFEYPTGVTAGGTNLGI